MSSAANLEGVGDLYGFAELIVQEQLRRKGAYLRPHLQEDLVSFLVERALKIAPRYDPSYGYAFTTFLSRRLRFAMIDWYRREFGDARYGFKKPHAHYVELEEWTSRAPAIDFERDLGVDEAVAEMSTDLSPDAAWALKHIAAPIAEGWSERAALKGSDVPIAEAKRRLEVLRQEVGQKGSNRSSAGVSCPARVDPGAKEEARELYRAGASQRELAERFGVTQTSVWRWVQGVERDESSDHELSIRQAAAVIGTNKDNIARAIADGRLAAHWGTRASNNGRTGPREHWIILSDELNRFAESLGSCRHPECERRGISPEGFCSRSHTMSVLMSGEAQSERMREEALRWWKDGNAPQVRSLYEGHFGGRARQRWGGRWSATNAPHAGSLPRGRQPIALEQGDVDKVRALAAQGWGRRAIATRLAVSERAVRNVLST